MTALAALILNLVIAAAILAAGWKGLDLLPMEPLERSRFRGALVLIAIVIAINIVYGYNQSGWWPIWQRFE